MATTTSVEREAAFSNDAGDSPGTPSPVQDSPPGLKVATEQRSHWDYAWRRLRRDQFAIGGGLMVLVLFGLAIGASWVSPHDPLTQFPDGLTGDFGVPISPAETSKFPLGTDSLGRDFLSRLIWVDASL